MIYGCHYGSTYSYYCDWHRQMVNALNRATNQEFIRSLVRESRHTALSPESISLLTRAVNRPKVRGHIRQPCWRAGRWKSLT